MLYNLELLSTTQFVEKYGISWRHVLAKRREIGVPSKFKGGSRMPHFTQRMIDFLGKRPDKVLARNFAMGVGTVRRMRVSLDIAPHKASRSPWTPDALALLGKIPDLQLARKLNISGPSVLSKRRHLKIPPFPFREKVRWTRKRVALLGTMSDSKLAQFLGVGKSSVHRQRVRLNIPAYNANAGQ
jgi:hypothetical protein